jgi:hypothetical protein
LYDFTIGEFNVVYEQAGADEVVSLDYDSADLDDYASLTLDRSSASQGSEVHLVITDNQLNIDPTAEDIVIFYVSEGRAASQDYGVSFTNSTLANTVSGEGYVGADYNAWSNSFDDNGKLIIVNHTNSGTFSAGESIFTNDATIDDPTADDYLVFYEGGENSGIFYNTDDDDDANLVVFDYAARGTTATIDYNDSAQSFVVANDFGTIDMDAASVGDAWNSGEALTVTLIDQDLNKNSASDEDLAIKNSTRTHLIPSLQIGDPLMLGQNSTLTAKIVSVSNYSNIAYLDVAAGNVKRGNLTLPTNWSGTELAAMNDGTDELAFFNYDVTALLNSTNTGIQTEQTMNSICLQEDSATNGSLVCDTDSDGRNIVKITGTASTSTAHALILVNFTNNHGGKALVSVPIIADVFSFGTATNNAIYRILLEETGDNTATFEGSIEYTMLNQVNIGLDATYAELSTIDQDVDIIVEQDMTDEDSPRTNYLDLGADGVSTQIADQLEAPTHNGVVSFDLDNYKIGDTVVVTLDDQDMNADSELIDVYTVDSGTDMVGSGTDATKVLDITFDDTNWNNSGDDADCTAAGQDAISGSDGLFKTGFTLTETGAESGIFQGSFQVPTNFCYTDGAGGNTDLVKTVTGTDIEVNYQDFRNASGEATEVGDGASINANTGSVSFDRTVYPVPYGKTSDANFLIHATASTTEFLPLGNVTVHVRVTDADYNVSAMGEDVITDANVTMHIERGSSSKFLATWGNTTAVSTGTIKEVSPDSGVFEIDQTVLHTDGPTTNCPTVLSSGCILQGDIITVEYKDNNDASGKPQTVTDSATFDLRNGVLQADKSVYLIGSDMILTLIEPDFDLDNDAANSVPLSLIEWDSDAKTTTLAGKVSDTVTAADRDAFDPEPSELRETGDSTGIFQVVIEIPEELGGDKLDRGEKIDLEYTDWGPAGADYVGQEDEDIGLTIYTSNFGATIELDQKVYTWTDKVYITIVRNRT